MTRAYAMLALAVVGCGRMSAPFDPTATDSGTAEEVDGSVVDSSPVETAKPVDATVDAPEVEYCPDPRYPPRTDGCPCDIGTILNCTYYERDKECFYPQRCPGEADTWRCTLVFPKEGKPYYTWQRCAGDCKTERCIPTTDAGPD